MRFEMPDGARMRRACGAMAIAIAAMASMASIASLASAQTGATALARIRGTIEDASATTLTVRDDAGARHALPFANDFVVAEVAPIDPAALQPGVFLGTTAIPNADGSLAALEVHVLPDAQRGRNEGHRVIDAARGATMTNATVAMVRSSATERTLLLRYADGEKTVRVPEGVPVVAMTPGTRALLMPGAKVTVTTQERNGRPTAVRIVVGRDGYAPPL